LFGTSQDFIFNRGLILKNAHTTIPNNPRFSARLHLQSIDIKKLMISYWQIHDFKKTPPL